jgi:hypothetical protein
MQNHFPITPRSRIEILRYWTGSVFLSYFLKYIHKNILTALRDQNARNSYVLIYPSYQRLFCTDKSSIIH